MRKFLYFLTFTPLPFITVFGSNPPLNEAPKEQIIAQRELNLTNRYPTGPINEIFKDNILLNLAYLRGVVKTKADVNWDRVVKPFTYEFLLEPGKSFAYHDDVDEKYQQTLVKTTGAHFNSNEGFKSSGFLFGDGVCHLASVIYWAAHDAKLTTEVPTDHDFRAIPDVPKEYGVSIYTNPFAHGTNTKHNLYITNNRVRPVAFKFRYDGTSVQVSVTQLN